MLGSLYHESMNTQTETNVVAKLIENVELMTVEEWDMAINRYREGMGSRMFRLAVRSLQDAEELYGLPDSIAEAVDQIRAQYGPDSNPQSEIISLTIKAIGLQDRIQKWERSSLTEILKEHLAHSALVL